MQNNMEDQDWNIKEDPIFDKFNELTTGVLNRVINIDYKTIFANTDWKTRNSKRDYKTEAAKRDYKAEAAKRDYKAIHAKRTPKMYKPVLQFDLEGNFIKEWNSGKEAAIALDKNTDGISACCKGKQKSAFGFIWKFKEEKK